jgi:hypothetical protein
MLTGLSPAPAARSSGVQRTSQLVTRWGSPPHPLASRTTPCPHRSADHSADMVWAARVSLATTPRILSFPQGTEMFQFPRFPHTALCVQAGVPRLNRGGLLHSGTLGSLRGSHSPRRFAASPRPSSALQAKASTARPSMRHHSRSRVAHPRPRRARVGPHPGVVMDRYCCSSSAIGLDRSRHDTPLSTSPCGTSNEVESGGAPARCLSRGLPTADRDPRLRPPRRHGDVAGSTGYWGQDPPRSKRPRARPSCQ